MWWRIPAALAALTVCAGVAWLGGDAARRTYFTEVHTATGAIASVEQRVRGSMRGLSTTTYRLRLRGRDATFELTRSLFIGPQAAALTRGKRAVVHYFAAPQWREDKSRAAMCELRERIATESPWSRGERVQGDVNCARGETYFIAAGVTVNGEVVRSPYATQLLAAPLIAFLLLIGLAPWLAVVHWATTSLWRFTPWSRRSGAKIFPHFPAAWRATPGTPSKRFDDE